MKYTGTVLFMLSFFFSVAQPPLQLKLPVTPKDFYATTEFSNNGLILFSEFQRTYLVDALTGRTVYDFKKTTRSSFSADGKYILTRYNDGADIWEIATQKTIYHFTAPEAYNMHDAVITADSKFLVAVLINNTSWPITYEWITIDIPLRQPLYKSTLPGENPKLANSAKTHLLATYSYSGMATVHNIENSRQVYAIDIGKDTITSMEFSADDQLIAVASTGGNIFLFNAATGKIVSKVVAHSGPVTAASFSTDTKNIVSSSYDKTIKIWNTASGKLVKQFIEKEPVSTVSFSPKNNYLIAAMEYNWLNIINIATGIKHNPMFLSVAKYAGRKMISPDEQLYYASSQVLKLSNAETVYTFRDELGSIKISEVSNNGRYIATIKGYNNVSIWDMETAKMIADFGMPDTSRYLLYANDITFSGDNETLFIAWNNGMVWKWNIESGSVDTTFSVQRNIKKLMMNQKKDQLLVISDSSVTALHVPSLTKQFYFKKDDFSFPLDHSVIYSPDESFLLLNGGQNKKVYVLNAVHGETITEIDKENWNGLPVITPDNKKLVLVYNDNTSFTYDLQTGKEVQKLKQGESEFIPEWAEMGNDSILLVLANSSYPAKQTFFQTWNINSGKLNRVLPFTAFKKMYFNDTAFFLTQANDSVKMWETKTLQYVKGVEGSNMFIDAVNKRVMVQNEFSIDIYSHDLKKIISLVSFGESNTMAKYISSGGIAILHNNYYKADPAAVNKIHLQSGLKVIGVNQLDIQLNRPDKVLVELRSKDTALLSAYRSAFAKRLRNLSLSENFVQDIAAPVAEIKNRNQIVSQQIGPSLKLNIAAYDSTSFIDKYNVWVNDVPVFGSNGVDLSKKNTKKLENSIIINLSKGPNQVEFSVTNRQGKESYRQPLHVFMGAKKSLDEVHGYQSYDANEPKEGTVYFIGIGIDKYRDSKYNLQWSVKDIRDLVTGMAGKNYRYNTVIDTLFNENVTALNVTALKKKLMNTTVDDKVIIAYSGHGLLSDNYDYYLSTYTINFLKPEEGGFAYTALESMLDSIPARKKLMLIDACHSGEVDKEDMKKIKTAISTEKKVKDGVKGAVPVEFEDEKKLGMKNSFELMQELFVNLGRSTGATIISAAAGTQFALERGDLKNGVFSYSILEYMKEHSSCTVSELKRYVNKRVPELTKGLQQPTTRTETRALDWEVW